MSKEAKDLFKKILFLILAIFLMLGSMEMIFKISENPQTTLSLIFMLIICEWWYKKVYLIHKYKKADNSASIIIYGGNKEILEFEKQIDTKNWYKLY